MRMRRRPDTWLAKLGAITGITDEGALLDLGQIVDDVLEVRADSPLFTDWLGVRYAVAVFDGVMCDVFVTHPLQCVRAPGDVALVARAEHADRLRSLVASGRRADVNRARTQRRAPRVFLDRVCQPAGNAGDREDDLAGTAHHAAHLA